MWHICSAHVTFNFHCIESCVVNRFVVHVWKCWNTQQNMNELHLLHKSFCTCLMWNCMSPIVKYKVIENTFEMKRRKSQREIALFMHAFSQFYDNTPYLHTYCKFCLYNLHLILYIPRLMMHYTPQLHNPC